MKRISAIWSALLIGTAGLAHSAPGASSEYINDLQTSYNQDQTTEVFQMVNFVSCLIKGMAPEKKINQPRYLALVDEAKCEGTNEGASETGGGNTANVKYSRSVTSVSLNANNQMVIKAQWKASGDSGAVFHYRILVTVTSGPAVAPPYGEWEMDFCGTLEGSENQPCKHLGYIRINARQVATFNIEGTRWSSKGKVVLSGTNSGHGITAMSDTQGNDVNEGRISFAFESGRYLRKTQSYRNNNLLSDATACLNPNITDQDTKFAVWENWLYDQDTGARIAYKNRGFQIRNADGESIGSANYWGVNFWDQSTPADQQDGALVRGVYEGTDTQFRLNKSPGRLEKITVSGSSLSSLDGINFKFNFWGKDRDVLNYVYANDASSLAKISGIQGWFALVGTWNHGAQSFSINGFQSCNPNCEITMLPSASISYADLTSRAGALQVDGFGGWVDGAGMNFTAGLVSWANNTQVVNAVADVIVLRESRVIVTPPEAAALFTSSSLVCVGHCYAPSGTGLASSSPSNWPPRAADVYTYTWDANAKAPKAANGALLSFTDRAAYPNGAGIRLYDASTLPAMSCGYWDANANQYQNTGAYCEWDYTRQPNSVYYSWWSGPDSWNQYSYLTPVNSQTPVRFDPPIILKYTAPAAGSLPVGVNPGYAGKEIQVESPAAGELWLPGKCIDRVTREISTCNENSDWINDLYIPFSQTLGRVRLVNGTTGQTTNTEYLVKWLKRGVVYAQKNSSVCSSLSLSGANSLSLPTEAEWKNPALTMPWDATASEFNANPVVIDGVMQ